MSNQLNVWIGLAHVRPGLGASDEASDFAGAYVWVAGAGEGRDDFRRNVSAAVESDGYFLVELEDVATREQHATHDRLSEEMMSLAYECLRTSDLAFGTGHAYDKDD